jgi:hypothetical protein
MKNMKLILVVIGLAFAMLFVGCTNPALGGTTPTLTPTPTPTPVAPVISGNTGTIYASTLQLTANQTSTWSITSNDATYTASINAATGLITATGPSTITVQATASGLSSTTVVKFEDFRLIGTWDSGTPTTQSFQTNGVWVINTATPVVGTWSTLNGKLTRNSNGSNNPGFDYSFTDSTHATLNTVGFVKQ